MIWLALEKKNLIKIGQSDRISLSNLISLKNPTKIGPVLLICLWNKMWRWVVEFTGKSQSKIYLIPKLLPIKRNLKGCFKESCNTGVQLLSPPSSSNIQTKTPFFISTFIYLRLFIIQDFNIVSLWSQQDFHHDLQYTWVFSVGE